MNHVAFASAAISGLLLLVTSAAIAEDAARIGGASSTDTSAGAVSSRLPLMAQDPQATKDASSPWKGMYFGTQMTAISRKGGGGGIGGSGYIGYQRQFDNNVFVAIQGNAGYMPSLIKRGAFGGPSGFDYASSSIKTGYDFGRVRTYVTAGFGVAAPTSFGGGGLFAASNSLNNVFNALGRSTFATVGAGVDYKVTDNITVGVSASVRNLKTNNDVYNRYGAYGPYGPLVPPFMGQ